MDKIVLLRNIEPTNLEAWKIQFKREDHKDLIVEPDDCNLGKWMISIIETEK